MIRDTIRLYIIFKIDINEIIYDVLFTMHDFGQIMAIVFCRSA